MLAPDAYRGDQQGGALPSLHLTTAADREKWLIGVAEKVTGESRGDLLPDVFLQKSFDRLPDTFHEIIKSIRFVSGKVGRPYEGVSCLRSLYRITAGDAEYSAETKSRGSSTLPLAMKSALESMDRSVAGLPEGNPIRQQYLEIIMGQDPMAIAPELRATSLFNPLALDIGRLSAPSLAKLLQRGLMNDPQATTIALGQICEFLSLDIAASAALRRFLAPEKVDNLDPVGAERARKYLVTKLYGQIKALPDHLDHTVTVNDDLLGHKKVRAFCSNAPLDMTFDIQGKMLAAFNQVDFAQVGIEHIAERPGCQRLKELASEFQAIGSNLKELEGAAFKLKQQQDETGDLEDQLHAELFGDYDLIDSIEASAFDEALIDCTRGVLDLIKRTTDLATEIKCLDEITPVINCLKAARSFLQDPDR